MKFSEHIYDDILNKAIEDFEESHELMLCIKLIKYLFESKAKTLNHITYNSFKTALKLAYDEESDAKLVKVTAYLSSNRLPLLDMKFQYIDEYITEPIPLEDSVVHDALNDNIFYHPDTGEYVKEFRQNIYPYFLRSGLLKKIHE